MPPIDKAVLLLREALRADRPDFAELTADRARLGFLRFARQGFDTAATPDSDGLLFQYGTHAFGGAPMFILGLARQFEVIDANGDHDHFRCVRCELSYPPEPELRELGTFDWWRRFRESGWYGSPGLLRRGRRCPW